MSETNIQCSEIPVIYINKKINFQDDTKLSKSTSQFFVQEQPKQKPAHYNLFGKIKPTNHLASTFMKNVNQLATSNGQVYRPAIKTAVVSLVTKGTIQNTLSCKHDINHVCDIQTSREAGKASAAAIRVVIVSCIG